MSTRAVKLSRRRGAGESRMMGRGCGVYYGGVGS
jgi:hypothetical protein